MSVSHQQQCEITSGMKKKTRWIFTDTRTSYVIVHLYIIIGHSVLNLQTKNTTHDECLLLARCCYLKLIIFPYYTSHFIITVIKCLLNSATPPNNMRVTLLPVI